MFYRSSHFMTPANGALVGTARRVAAVFAAVCFVFVCGPPVVMAGDRSSPEASPADALPEAPADWWSAVQKDIAASEYQITWQEHGPIAEAPEGWHAANRAQNLRTYFTAQGFRCVPRNVRPDEMSPWQWGLSYVGCNGAPRSTADDPTRAALHIDGNRVEYDHGDVIEWYINDARGLEQGFTVLERRSAEGAGDRNDGLRLEMAVTGSVTASLADNGAAVDFLAPGGARAIRFNHLHANDAAGRELATRFEVSSNPQSSIPAPQLLSIVVDDRDAAYPITIDPLATSPAWTAESDQASAQFGWSAATAGDVNGDGFGDVIVGAYLFDNGQTDEGRAFVYHGSPAGLSATPNWTAESDQAGANFGFSVATAGDVNGDGYSDVIVGSINYDNGQTDEGRAYVYLGSATGLSAAAAWTAESNQAFAGFGWSVATAGDVNGDGYSDVIVGVPNYDNGQTNEGRAYIYHGSATGPNAAANWTAESNLASAQFGWSVATAGDVNGDGYSDVIVGARLFNNGEVAEGRAFAWFGSASGLGANGTPANADWTAESNQANATFGASVAAAGDVNGDGYSDVIVGAPLFDNGETNEGRAYVYHGSATGLVATAAWTAESDQGDASFGASVGTAGDVNGDGFSDVIVGANFYDNDQTNEGRAFVYHGSAAGLSPTAAWTAESNQDDARSGVSVATAGDVNGDGFSDVIVGAYWYDNGQTNEGRAFLYLGAATGLSATSGWFAGGNEDGSGFGYSVAGAGDVNGDGYSDVIVGAPLDGAGQFDAGQARVYHGSATGLSTTADWTAAENGGFDAHFGSSVATAGDVNGDGYSDVIVGAPLHVNSPFFPGRAFVYHGSPAGLSTTPDWIAAPTDYSAFGLGNSVAGAGDVNGDGYSDVIVGAGESLGGEGKAFVYYGSAGGLGAAPDWTAGSNQASALLGSSVATAGDVNGDGYSDVIVGAPFYDNGQNDEGRAFVWYGSSSGLGADGTPANADWTAESNSPFAGFGWSAATAGDVNGDGYSDVIVGAPLFDDGPLDVGRAYAYYGGAAGLSTTVAWIGTLPAVLAQAQFGFSVATAGDVNGDGYSDVIVGAPGFQSAGQSLEGWVFVRYGSSNGLGGDWTAESNRVNAMFGTSAACAGDVNGDGYSDVIVGAPSYHDGQIEAGRAFVYHGNGGPSISLKTQQRRADNTAPIDRLGRPDSPSGFRVAQIGRTPFGRGRVKLEFEIKPLGTAFDGTGLRQGVAYADAGLGGVSLNELAVGLDDCRLYHWRARTRYNPATTPFQAGGRWVSPFENGWQESDILWTSLAVSAGEPQTICADGTTSSLGGSTPSGGSGIWSVVSGGNGMFSPDDTTPDATFTHTGGAGPIVLRWTISNPTCSSYADLTVTVHQPPTTATVGSSQTVCVNDITSGLGGSTPAVGTGSWSVVSGGTGTFDPDPSTPDATFTHTEGAGPIVLRWTISHPPCLDSTADVTVIVLGFGSGDCNANDIPDECDIAAGIALDCNANGVPDECDFSAGVSLDCNANDIPDECDIAGGASMDCNGNGVPDNCDIAAGAPDCNANGVPDDCDVFPSFITRLNLPLLKSPNRRAAQGLRRFCLIYVGM